MNIGFDYIGITTPFYCNDGKGKWLLHKRSVKCRDEHGRWDFGSGKLEFGLTLEENVLKEVLEEYGCKGEIQQQLPALPIFREINGRKTHWVAIPFFVKVNSAEVKNNEPHKMEEMSWFTFDALPTPMHSGYQQTAEQLKPYFETIIESFH